MTDKEIRIISRKKKELFEKTNSVALLKYMFKDLTEEDLKKNPEEAKALAKSFEAMHQMKALDDLMKELGYEWDISQSLYVEKDGNAKSYADAWDAVTGRKKDSEEDEETDEDDSADNEESCKDDENGEDCDACELNGRCPIQNADRKTETTIIHHHDEIKDKDFKRDLLNNPELRITVKGSGIAIKGKVTTIKLIALVCELLSIISKNGTEAIRALVDVWNRGADSKKLHLAMKEDSDEGK